MKPFGIIFWIYHTILYLKNIFKICIKLSRIMYVVQENMVVKVHEFV